MKAMRGTHPMTSSSAIVAARRQPLRQQRHLTVAVGENRPLKAAGKTEAHIVQGTTEARQRPQENAFVAPRRGGLLITA